ncbi:MAG: flagellin [Chitinivibrionales bacterium]
MQIQRTGGVGFVRAQNKTSKALSTTNRALKIILHQLSTAQRINRASDDAAGLSISEMLRSQVRGFKSASRNVEDAVSALNIADGSSQEIGSILQRQRELALQARNDTLTDKQRTSLDAEYQSLQHEIDRIAQSTQFNRQKTSNGEGLADGDAKIQVGPDQGDEVSLPALDMSVDALGLSGASVATSAGAADALGRVDGAIDDLNAQRSLVGSVVNRFSSTMNNLEVAHINTQAAESVIRDQDMAAGLIELTRQRLLNEGATAAFGRFHDISANHVLSLLQ